MRKHKFSFALTSLLLAALLFTACPPPEEEKTETSAPPVISVHPTSAWYLAADTVEALTVSAAASDNGTLSYQWFEADSYKNSDGTAIEGAADRDYTPEKAAAPADKFYYVEVTNKKGGLEPSVKASNPARIQFLASAPQAPAANVAISSDNAQYIRGFGGMSNGFAINPASDVRYMELEDIDTMFNPDGELGYNILRIMIWPNPLEDVLSGEVNPAMNNQGTYLEAVKKVNAYGGYVMASPWTPLPEWKKNKSNVGGPNSELLREHYGDYANFLTDYAKGMARRGAPIYALSIQNEPTVPTDYDGCDWSSKQQVDFFLDVGKFLQGVPGYGGGQALASVKNMSGEPHQAVTWNNAARDNDEVNSYIDIYAYHIYGNMNNSYTQVQQDTDSGRKEVWMTEHNTNSGGSLEQQDYSWNYAWVIADEVDYVIRINSSNAYVHWYLKRYYGMIGENAYGTVNGAILPRGHVLAHWAKYAADTVRVPAVVSGHPDGGNASDVTTTATVSVKASAYRRKAAPVSYWEKQVKRQEDSISLVIYNNKTSGGSAQDIRVNLPADFGEAKYVHAIISDSSRKQVPHLIVLNKDKKSADFNLPANSIVSLKFAK